MILYSVTISVDTGIETEWRDWMQFVHIPEVIKTGYFVGYTMQELLDPPPQRGTSTYNVQYQCESMAQYQAYQIDVAKALQKDHQDRYGEKAVAFRTLLRLIDKG